MKNTKLILFSLFAICLASIVFWISWSMANTSINLNESSSTNEKLTKIYLNKYHSTYITRTRLVLVTNSKSKGYYIFRASQNYDDITSKLAIGKSIKIYHSKLNSESDMHTIYQAEQNKKIIYPKQEYEKQEQFAGKYIGLPAAILMAIVIIRALILRFLKPKT